MLHARMASVSCPATARSKALPDDQLVPEEGVLHTGLLMVARVLLPLSPSSLLHLSDRAVARGRSWSPSRHGGCPGRWNDDRRATRTRSLVDATRVVGRVRREAGDVAFDRVDQIEGRRRVVNMPAGQGVSDDHARSVDAQMKLLPAAYTASAMFHGRPFTFTHSREPGTVDDEMYACARGVVSGGGEVQGRGADHAVRESCDRARTGRGTASRRSTSESPPSDEGAGERSGGASARFRWQPRSTAAALRACRRPRPPTWRSLPASTTG